MELGTIAEVPPLTDALISSIWPFNKANMEGTCAMTAEANSLLVDFSVRPRGGMAERQSRVTMVIQIELTEGTVLFTACISMEETRLPVDVDKLSSQVPEV